MMKRWMLLAEPEILLDRAAHAAALEWNVAWVYDRSNRYWTRAAAFRAGADLVLGEWGARGVTFRVMRVPVVW